MKKSKMILKVTTSRLMPPWKAIGAVAIHWPVRECWLIRTGEKKGAAAFFRIGCLRRLGQQRSIMLGVRKTLIIPCIGCSVGDRRNLVGAGLILRLPGGAAARIIISSCATHGCE